MEAHIRASGPVSGNSYPKAKQGSPGGRWGYKTERRASII